MAGDVQLRGAGGDSIADRLTPLGLGWPNVVSILRVLLVPVLVELIVAVALTVYSGLDYFVRMRPARANR